jgi:AraC-like DNA-binding protein
MPIVRQFIASDSAMRVEKITAAARESGWSAVHEANEWRWVLPGKGLVQWRSPRELVFVDPLTAFQLAPGDAYQLRHQGEREHHVLCSRSAQVIDSVGRAWLLPPGELFQVRRALAALRRGDTGDVARAGLVARAALDRAIPLRASQICSALLVARHCVASASHEHLQVEELAEEAHCSPFHLSRLFRHHLGVSPHRYRLHLRLAHALQRLEDKSTSLSDLAFELGFSSQSHFGELFRRAIGCTPGQARVALK